MTTPTRTPIYFPPTTRRPTINSKVPIIQQITNNPTNLPTILPSVVTRENVTYSTPVLKSIIITSYYSQSSLMNNESQYVVISFSVCFFIIIMVICIKLARLKYKRELEVKQEIIPIQPSFVKPSIKQPPPPPPRINSSKANLQYYKD